MIELPLVTKAPALLGKRVLLRLDFNVPLAHAKVRDAYRILRSLETLNFLRESGARTVIISHVGKGKPEESLEPIANYLSAEFPLTFLSQLENPDNMRIINAMQDGDIVLLENLRHSKKEEANDPAFAQYLAALGDVYVNDAFSVSHRAHASVVGVPKLLPHYAGLLMEQEVGRLSAAFNPPHPFLFILGGVKLSTKMPLLKKFLTLADRVFVGGTVANTFFKAQGHEIGRSVYDQREIDGLKEYIANEKLILPGDVIVKNDAGSEECKVDEVTSEDMIVDVGTETVRNMEAIVGSAKLIVWNGPLGYYEAGFTEGTRDLLSLVSGASATSIIGGGDTVALIDEMHALDRFSFVSTGGGAMLDFLANETLPGIEALK